tara:strand:- start:1071 stop:1244 length:174 start_codon:yes stop_codon:yes gene_type:complete
MESAILSKEQMYALSIGAIVFVTSLEESKEVERLTSIGGTRRTAQMTNDEFNRLERK